MELIDFRGGIRTTGLAMACLLWTMAARALGFEKLPESVSSDAKAVAVVFDFDSDSCYPSPAISKDGKVNGGLKPSGKLTGDCRDPEQLKNSNTFLRTLSIQHNGNKYSVYMFALYFKKDQFITNPLPWVEAGHRHDWEFALVWTKNGEITHASHSAHGKVFTVEKQKLPFDAGREQTVKIVYHKDDIKTHAFRFAKPNEAAENDAKKWITPTLVDWHTMYTEQMSNESLRKKLNDVDFGAANCPVNDKNFSNEISKNPPPEYPSAEDLRAAAKARQ